MAPLLLPADLRLTPEQRRGFAPLCPDLVVELASPSEAAGFSEGVEDRSARDLVGVIRQKPSPCWATVMLVPGHSGRADGWMLERLAEALVGHGLQVIRFDFRYVRQHMRGGVWTTWPDDSLQWQELEFRQQVLSYRRQERLETERLPLILGGYSRGGLIATLVADLTSAAGSFALGFPFHPPGNTTEWRCAHLAVAIKPVLLLNGDQDPYGYPDELVDVPLAESVELHWLPDRNHGMTFAGDVDRNAIDSIHEMAVRIVAFCQRLIGEE